ncbi:hypothetical protein Acid345_4449 [Candidatus Koribacter versatilis Ellin345]|uniref:Photosynthesis system II assembly factor Ycf48/Hcf136-like domain-containing protein n=1 Tax=Koribacter versatilis (strain Ellin345) TaxID=204669 RepID=Q1II51_KORVE|nr:zf-HC2 domain-containing protein [Candidatus Koribacter versatilis]ABF43449.1 hypothetical protein Acid345_4449 [Candidatus Koribacter versatilis Ellin345]
MSSDFQNRLRKNLEHPVPAEHPAPDVLNAYIEKVLTGAEERQVTEHLAACRECREVVFLATGAAEEPVQPVVAAVPVKRVRWWAWAMPIVAVVVIAIFIGQPSLLRSKHTVEMAQARHDEPQVPASTTVATKTEVAPANKEEDKAKSLETYQPRKRIVPAQPLGGLATSPAAPPSPAPTERRELAKEKDVNGPVQNEMARRAGVGGRIAEEAKPAVAMSAPAPAAADKVQTLKQSEGAAAANLQQDSKLRDDRYAYSTESTNGASLSANGASRSKAANLDTKAGQAFGGFAKSAAKKVDAATQWRVTTTGGLEHALLGEWKPALGDSSSHFLAVTTFGENVWAGGKNLALYHSPDNGVTWERQTLRVRIAADITQIQFTSANDGVLTTNLGTSFVTHDGGKSWAQEKP